jgi:hypothetical protein
MKIKVYIGDNHERLFDILTRLEEETDVKWFFGSKPTKNSALSFVHVNYLIYTDGQINKYLQNQKYFIKHDTVEDMKNIDKISEVTPNNFVSTIKKIQPKVENKVELNIDNFSNGLEKIIKNFIKTYFMENTDKSDKEDLK